MSMLTWELEKLRLLLFLGSTKIFNIFSSGNELTIPWTSIKCIGPEIILVEL